MSNIPVGDLTGGSNEIACTIISLISLVDIQQGKEYSVLGKYGVNHITILDDKTCERLLAHCEYVNAGNGENRSES